MKAERALPVGFCPFCKESFENLARCPAHDLPLVPWSELPKEARDDDEPREPLAFGDGRWSVMVAAATTVVGFFLPVISVDEVPTTGALLAMERAPNAWIIPACAVASLAVVFRRRTAFALRGARFVIVFFGLVVLASMAFTARALIRGAALAESVLEPRVGAYVLAAAVVAYLLTPFVLGRQVESGR